MSEKPFADQSHQPDEDTLASVLENTYSFYSDLLGLASGFKKQWNYSKSGGWMLKVYDAGKALLYLIPLNGMFKVSLTLRENERVLLLQNEGVRFAHDAMINSKKYSEGYALQFPVSDTASSQNCAAFIGEIIKLRS